MKDIIEIVKSLEDFGSLSKGVSETIQNKSKKHKGELLSMLLGTLSASLIGNILAGKRINRAGEGPIAKRKGQGIERAGYANKKVQKTTRKNKKNFKCHLIL